jgi:putative endonuclease
MPERAYYVYILSSRSRTLYTGMTNDLERRVYQHKHGLVSGFTSKYRIDRLVYYESFRDVRDAIAREKQIKAWTRAKRIALESQNPAWADLAENDANRWKLVEAALRSAEQQKRHAKETSAEQHRSADSSLRSE